ncbi:MAG: hypothetical protein LBB45_01135 [Methanobrevibacter sp.]|jgi:hypothetical protein|nr:hypothetical protein [Candidatus Methanovirga basalitermitum]
MVGDLCHFKQIRVRYPIKPEVWKKKGDTNKENNLDVDEDDFLFDDDDDENDDDENDDDEKEEFESEFGMKESPNGSEKMLTDR